MSEKENFSRTHLIIEGLVQGVFFRAWTQQKARELGIRGWVRNLADGRVEAVFEGEKAKLEKMVEWTKRGPATARVDEVLVEWQEYKGEFKTFEIRQD